MYYINEEHRQNFEFLLQQYKQYKNDRQHLAAIYVASVPDIFPLLDLEEMKEENPLMHVMEFDEDQEKMVASHPGLTGNMKMLVTIGASLFNGTPCDLDIGFSPKFAKAVINACEIRYGLTSVDTSYYKGGEGYSIIQ